MFFASDEFTKGIRAVKQKISQRAKGTVPFADSKPEALVRYYGTDEELNRSLDSIRRTVETLSGSRGSQSEHAVTFRALEASLKALEATIKHGALATNDTAKVAETADINAVQGISDAAGAQVAADQGIADAAVAQGILNSYDSNLDTFNVQANTTISPYGSSVTAAVSAAACRAVLGVDASGSGAPTKFGATQVLATAVAGELWYTVGHATLPNYVVMVGV